MSATLCLPGASDGWSNGFAELLAVQPPDGYQAAVIDPLADAIAVRVAELVRESPRTSDRVDAAELARQLGVGRGYVYEHKAELGAMPLTEGPKPRLRFDAEKIKETLAARAGQAQAAPPVAARSPRRAPRRETGAVPLLPIKGQAPSRGRGR